MNMLLGISKHTLDFGGFQDLRVLQRGDEVTADMRGEIGRCIRLFKSCIGSTSYSWPVGMCIHPRTGVRYEMILYLSREGAQVTLDPLISVSVSASSSDKAKVAAQETKRMFFFDDASTLPLYTVIPLMAAMPSIKQVLEGDEDAAANFQYLRETVKFWDEVHAEEEQRTSIAQKIRKFFRKIL